MSSLYNFIMSSSLSSTDETLRISSTSGKYSTEAENVSVIDFDSDDSMESMLPTERNLEDLIEPKFFQMWKNIPTIEEFIKPSKHREVDQLDSEEGEEEMESELDQISTDLEYKDEKIYEKRISEMGIIEEEEEVSEHIDQLEKEEHEEEEESSTETESTQSSDLQLPEYDDEIVKRDTGKAFKTEEAAQFEELINLETIKDHPNELSFLSRRRTPSEAGRYQYQKYQIVEDFLNELIMKTVDVIERVQTKTALRFNLDKRKLILRLCTIYNQYVVESKVTEFLQKKIVDYCRRKKLIRYLTVDNVKTIEFEKNKLDYNMKRLDVFLKMQSDIKGHFEKVETKLHKELVDMRNAAFAEVEKFETLVKETCRIDSKSKYFQESINNKFAAMAQIRSDINKMRFELLLKLDKQANLTEQLFNIQNIGKFSTVKYDAVQNEIRQIQEKIDEKTAEHKKAAGRINEKLGKIVHIKQIKEISIEKLESLFCNYMEWTRKFNKTRERKSKAYKVRQSLKNELKTIKIKGGLLDKKPLLLEYDSTIEDIKNRQNIVTQMHRKVFRLQGRIDQLQAASRRQSIIYRRKSLNNNRRPSLSSNTSSKSLIFDQYPYLIANRFSLGRKESDKYALGFRFPNIDDIPSAGKANRSLICPSYKQTNTSIRGKSVIIVEDKNTKEPVHNIDAQLLSKIKKVRKFETEIPSETEMRKSSRVFSNKSFSRSVSLITVKSFTNLKGVEDIKYPYPKDEWINTPTFMPL